MKARCELDEWLGKLAEEGHCVCLLLCEWARNRAEKGNSFFYSLVCT